MIDLREERGQTLVLAALCFCVLLGCLGFAIDVGMMFRARWVMQTAADAAAIAGAQELNYGDVTAAARADAASNGATDGSNGVSVTVNNPPLSGPHAGLSTYVEVIVSQAHPSMFMGVFGVGSMHVQARAVAGVTPTPTCMYTLGTSGTDINISNGANIQMPGCAIYDNSSSSTAFTITGGSTLNAQAISVVGNYSNGGGSTLIPSSPTTGAMAVSDPLAYLSPPSYNTSSCVSDPNLGSGGTFTIGPSSSTGTVCYNGLTIANGATATLKPGIYVIAGALTFGGGAKITGSGVTFYFPPGGSLAFANGITTTLSAPTSGTYNGILFYQARTNTNAASLQGGANCTLTGILYFPGANVTINNGTTTSSYAALVANSFTFAGGAAFKNYALSNSATPMTVAKTVE